MKPEEIPCIVLIFKCSAGRWMNKTVPHLQSHQPGEFNFLICLDGCWIYNSISRFLFIIPRVYCAHADRSWPAVFYSFYWLSSHFSYFLIFKMVHSILNHCLTGFSTGNSCIVVQQDSFFFFIILLSNYLKSSVDWLKMCADFLGVKGKNLT